MKTTFTSQQTIEPPKPRRGSLSDLLAKHKLSKVKEAAAEQYRNSISKARGAPVCFRCKLEDSAGEPVRFACDLCNAWANTTDLTTARMRFTSRREKEMPLV